MKKFIISDLHFGHTNLAYKRGFLSVFDHDETLIENWNSVVPHSDQEPSMIYVLGDVSLHNSKLLAHIMPRLNGSRKILISGNHDENVDNQYYESVYGAIQLKILGDMYVLTHIPIHPQELYKRWRANIHGHLHHKHVYEDWQDVCGDTQGTIKDKRYINVSAEHLAYTPQLLEDVVLDTYNKPVAEWVNFWYNPLTPPPTTTRRRGERD